MIKTDFPVAKGFHITDYIIYCFVSDISGEGSTRVVVAKMFDCDIVVREFELQSHYHLHFRDNILGKGINPLYLQSIG